jgi:pimeloyl-ACP methyl ester carboxylesterase
MVADGRRLVWSEHGDPAGHPVFWCHGGLSCRVDAELLATGLDGLGVRLIAADRPGIGESDRKQGRTVADWPSDVTAIADELDIDRFAVAGWSAGGPFALACAAALSRRVSAVATIGGMAPVRTRAQRKELGLATDRLMIPLARRAPWLAALALRPARRAKPERLKARLLKSVPAPDRAVLEPLPAEQAVGYGIAALHHGTHGTVDDYRAFGGDWGFDLADVRAPVTCWQGADDTLLPMTHARRLAEALPSGTLHVVPEAGHFLAVTHTAEVFGHLLDAAGT